MKPFNLSEYLENPSRKVVTRDGRPARIVCWDIDSDTPILVAFRLRQDREEVFAYGTDGKSIVNFEYDLFFADEEEKLTEFEKAVKQVMWTAYNYDDCSNGKGVDDIFNVKATSQTLLDLARKELKKEFKDEEYFRLIKEHYKKGKQDALKDLPKWKKAKENRTLPDDVVKIDEGGMVIHSDMVWEGEYFIMFQSLKSLPKEE